jgi:cell division protein FtsB
MIRIYAIAGLVLTLILGGLGSCAYTEKLKVAQQELQSENATLKANQEALKQKIEADQKIQASDAARAAADTKRITTFKEKSRATIKGTRDPGHVALDADATQRVRDIFAAGH